MDNRLFFSATERNRYAIREVLSRILPISGSVLEIGSGSGEHGVLFQKYFPHIIWQTSDIKISHRNSISSWIEYEKLNFKMPQPLAIDVEKAPWIIPFELLQSLQGIISINLIHIASWSCTKSLFKESGNLLKNGNFLMLYGPFKIRNKHTCERNNLFDQSLKMQNKLWGVRDLGEVTTEAIKYGFIQEELIQMPANNFTVIYRKVSLQNFS